MTNLTRSLMLGGGGGAGDVTGPGSSTDGAMVLFDGTDGATLKEGSAYPAAWSDEFGTKLVRPDLTEAPVGIDTYTWTELQTAYPHSGAALLALAANTMVYVADTNWRGLFVRNSAGTYWKALHRVCVVCDLTLSEGTLSTSNQMIKSAVVPAALLRTCRKFIVRCGLAKNGATDAVTGNAMTFGTAGTTADTVLNSMSAMAAGNRTIATEREFYLNSATEIYFTGAMNNSGWGGAVSGATYPTVITVANVDTTNNYLGITMQMAGSTNKSQCYMLELELVP